MFRTRNDDLFGLTGMNGEISTNGISTPARDDDKNSGSVETQPSE